VEKFSIIRRHYAVRKNWKALCGEKKLEGIVRSSIIRRYYAGQKKLEGMFSSIFRMHYTVRINYKALCGEKKY
jgi:hypothetical protein